MREKGGRSTATWWSVVVQPVVAEIVSGRVFWREGDEAIKVHVGERDQLGEKMKQ